MNIKDSIEEKMGAIHYVETIVKSLRDNVKALPRSGFPEKADNTEIIASITIAYRHLQDARTRLEWALEALRGES